VPETPPRIRVPWIEPYSNEVCERVAPPHAWIQWKGTDVCMDVRCACGRSLHLDASFTYFIECPHADCRRVYKVGAYVPLQEVPREVADRESNGPILCERDDSVPPDEEIE